MNRDLVCPIPSGDSIASEIAAAIICRYPTIKSSYHQHGFFEDQIGDFKYRVNWKLTSGSRAKVTRIDFDQFSIFDTGLCTWEFLYSPPSPEVLVLLRLAL